jgi:hypothetical protein
MSQKPKTGDNVRSGKKRHTVTMETKAKFIKRYENNEKLVDIAHAYEMGESIT